MLVAYRRGSVLFRHDDEIPRGKGNFGVFFPTDNALYNIAFETHAKTAEPIEMPLWMKTRVGTRNDVLDGGADLPEKGAIFDGCPGHSKALAIFAAAFATKGIINRQ